MSEQNLARRVAEALGMYYREGPVRRCYGCMYTEATGHVHGCVWDAVQTRIVSLTQTELAAAMREMGLANEAAQQANTKHAQAEDILAGLLCDAHCDAAWAGERLPEPCLRCELAAAMQRGYERGRRDGELAVARFNPHDWRCKDCNHLVDSPIHEACCLNVTTSMSEPASACPICGSPTCHACFTKRKERQHEQG